ncbi:TPA: hypothetical protein N0F65_003714, partial [Lagenidium giganteum]
MAQGQDQQVDEDIDPIEYASCWMVANKKQDTQEPIWILDSGASHHICDGTTTLFNTRPCDPVVSVADGRTIRAIVKGDTTLDVEVDGKLNKVLLRDVHRIDGHDYVGNKHLLHVVDYGSSFGQVFPMRCKSDWFHILTTFITKFEGPYDVKVKVVRSDNEFGTRQMSRWCEERRIRQPLTEPNESSSNGKVERRHRKIFDGMRAMLFDAHKAQGFYGNKPDLAHVMHWGQAVTAHVKSRTMGIKKKAERGVFIGFDEKTKGCRIYIPRTKKIVVTQHVQAMPTGDERISGLVNPTSDCKKDDIVNAYWHLAQSPA